MKNKKCFAPLLAVAILLALLLLFASSCQSGGKIEISELVGGKAYNDDGSVIVPKEFILFEVHGKNGEIIIENMCVKYKEDLSVADISKEVCRYKNIPFVTSGTGTVIYVQGINNLFEFDHGSESGWLYSVNGEFQSMSCGNYTVKDGDYVEWFYTLDFGKDVGADKLD